MDLNEEFTNLQNMFAFKDLMTRPKKNGQRNMFEILLVKKINMKIKIYQEIGHQLPHIHIDYGNIKHFASYAIESGERLEGNLDKKYDSVVVSWLETNRSKVLEIWKALQDGKDVKCLIRELEGDK